MCNLTGNVPSTPLQSAQPASQVGEVSAVKISGLPNLFDPSKASSALPNFQLLMSNSSKYGIVVQTFLQFRKDTPSVENSKGSTVYHIELDKSENLEGDDEFSEDAEEERDRDSREKDNERAKKMWLKAKVAILAGWNRKSRKLPISSLPGEDNSFFSLLSKK